MTPDFGARRVLLLQGPNGPFFRRFAAELRARGASVHKVNFHGGDVAFFPGPYAHAFRGHPSAWPAYLEALMDELGTEAVYVFGDGRPYHRVAAEVCARRNVRFFVFEEGYLRPDWITLEEHGVNGYSRMPRDPAAIRAFAQDHVAPRNVEHVGSSFGIGAFYATVLAICATFGSVFFPHYRHHRSIFFIAEMLRWIRGALRKYWFRYRERGVIDTLKTTHHKRYYFMALQVHCDYQLVHSRFESVEAFMTEVMRSFAEHAPADVKLVIKHHPMDRAYREYGSFLSRTSAELGLTDRVIYVHDLHLPTILRSALGSVMINSTVGLQSIQYGTPVKVLGDAVYDMAGMTHQGDLASFWHSPEPIDERLFLAFRTYLLCVNQANGSFARPLRSAAEGAGVRWFPGAEASVGTPRSLAESSVRIGLPAAHGQAGG
jgi:capsule polysaccharide modification protein KpsS